MVADVRERRLLALERPLLIARLHDFREGIVSLAHVRGRLPEGRESIPQQRFTEAAPDPLRAVTFMAAGGERFYYEVAQVAVDPDALRLVPTWRLAERPPAANALGISSCLRPVAGCRLAVRLRKPFRRQLPA